VKICMYFPPLILYLFSEKKEKIYIDIAKDMTYNSTERKGIYNEKRNQRRIY